MKRVAFASTSLVAFTAAAHALAQQTPASTRRAERDAGIGAVGQF